MRDELMDAVRRVAELPDLDARARAIAELIRDIQAATPAAVALRKAIIAEQRARGRTYQEIGELLGLHWASVAQIHNGRPAARRRRDGSGPDDTTPPGDSGTATP